MARSALHSLVAALAVLRVAESLHADDRALGKPPHKASVTETGEESRAKADVLMNDAFGLVKQLKDVFFNVDIQMRGMRGDQPNPRKQGQEPKVQDQYSTPGDAWTNLQHYKDEHPNEPPTPYIPPAQRKPERWQKYSWHLDQPGRT
mmetsp:Transcript_24383/g.68488  ORF Transcript_24383/g.68488 Transcript_24383/m.68488 type:complete len:147 (+) Transcript_24383:84-524(+)